MKLGRCLAVSLLVLFLAAPALAAPNLTGTWNVTLAYITPDGTISADPSFTVTMNLTQKSPAHPDLYSGTIVFPDKTEYIALQQDAGSNIHFAICATDNSGDSSTGYKASFQGRGTASAKKFTGGFSTVWGEVGSFTGTKQ
jgi:hypothetical protein